MLPEAMMRSQLYAQLRIGRVSSVDANRHSAQVQFFDQDGFVSWDLQVLRGFGGDYCLPAQNTPVLCAILDGRLGVGFVIGAFYTDSDAAPLSDAGQRAIVGDDMRLGAADASKVVGLDGDTCDAGEIEILGGVSNLFSGLQYTDPDGNVSSINATGAPLTLKAKLRASAQKVKAK